jgi:hypothetical protein
MANNIHVANTLTQSVYVLPAKSTEWVIADLVTDAALFAVGVSEIKAVLTGAQLPATINSIADLFAFLKGAGTLLSGTIAVGSRSGEAVLELVRHFKENSVEVPANDYRNVLESSFLDYFSASGLASLAGAETVTLTIMSSDGLRTAQFGTNNDFSWIITEQGAVRAKYGTIWQPSPGDGQNNWSVIGVLTGAIRTQTNHFFTATNNGGLGAGQNVAIRTDAQTVGQNEKFRLMLLDNTIGHFALQTRDGRYVTAVNNGGIGGPNNTTSPIHTDATAQGPWETMIFERQPDGLYAIKTSTGYYWTATNGGGWGEGANRFPVHTDARNIGPWETFTFVGSTPLA